MLVLTICAQNTRSVSKPPGCSCSKCSMKLSKLRISLDMRNQETIWPLAPKVGLEQTSFV